ncbi:MAG: DUF4249 domain-containing protein [Saprospiraceae bacterium]|nr:DUF4249 domain-containing protein [Saprospiraceae bacterium]MCB9325218.1 DUF4249 domain-containing protein [Lewinellaceae bacterium]
MTIRWYILLVLASVLSACVEEFQPKLDEFDNLLVVDGEITNEEGPYTIKLSVSSGLEIISPEPVTGATVAIVEENGVAETLTEQEPGIYRTAPGGIQGTVGKKYKLIINQNGKNYESEYELLKQPTPIASVEAVQEYKAFPDAPEEVPGIQFYVNTGTSSNEKDYYLWSQEGTYKYEANLLIYFVYEGVIKEFKNRDSLKTCYLTYKVGEVYTANTDNLTVPVITNLPLHFLPATDIKLTIRYSMLTRQYSITKQAYDFWHAIERQTSNGGALYTSQPYQIRGNLTNVNNPDEPVLGYFMVAGVAENRIFVDRPENAEIYIADCFLDYMGYAYIFGLPPSEWPIYVTQGEGGGRAVASDGCMDCRVSGGGLLPPPFWEE